MKLASRLDRIEPFYVMELAKAAARVAAGPLCDPAQAGPVILAWAVEGLGHWLRDGLGAGGCQGSDRCPTGADRNRWATAAHEDEGLPTASSSKRPPPPRQFQP